MPSTSRPSVKTPPASQGKVSFTGKSGRQHVFWAWPLDTRFKPVAAVYFITKRAYRNSTYRMASHDAIYIGQTENLAETFAATVSLERYLQHGANCICVFLLADAEQRLAIEQDLLASNSTYCNGGGNGRSNYLGSLLA